MRKQRVTSAEIKGPYQGKDPSPRLEAVETVRSLPLKCGPVEQEGRVEANQEKSTRLACGESHMQPMRSLNSLKTGQLGVEIGSFQRRRPRNKQ